MLLLRKIFSAQVWQGIGVFLALLIAFVSFYYASGRERWWLYLAVVSIPLLLAFVLGAELQQRGSTVGKVAMYLLFAAIGLGGGILIIAICTNSLISDGSATTAPELGQVSEPPPTYTPYPTHTPYPTLQAAPTYTPYPEPTLGPTTGPTIIVVTATPPPVVSATDHPAEQVPNITEPWSEDGVQIRLERKFSSDATVMDIEWLITNNTGEDLLIHYGPNMITAHDVSGEPLEVTAKSYKAGGIFDCEADQQVLKPNKNAKSGPYGTGCSYKVLADFSRVKEFIVTLSNIVDAVPEIKRKVVVPF